MPHAFLRRLRAADFLARLRNVGRRRQSTLTRPLYGQDIHIDTDVLAWSKAGAPASVWRWAGVINAAKGGGPDSTIAAGAGSARTKMWPCGGRRQRHDALDRRACEDRLPLRRRRAARRGARTARQPDQEPNSPAAIAAARTRTPKPSTPMLRHERLEQLASTHAYAPFRQHRVSVSLLMGQLDGNATGGCSGALTGRRRADRRALPVQPRQHDTWCVDTLFRPGREGTCGATAYRPYGGQHAGDWFFTPAAYRTSTNYDDDFGILVLVTAPGDFHGLDGLRRAIGESDLRDYCDDDDVSGDGRFQQSAAIPRADSSKRRLRACRSWACRTPTTARSAASLRSATPDNWNRRFTSTACDYSRGHSGSAVYTDVWAGDQSVVVGVVATQNCADLYGGRQLPERHPPRITPGIRWPKSPGSRVNMRVMHGASLAGAIAPTVGQPRRVRSAPAPFRP